MTIRPLGRAMGLPLVRRGDAALPRRMVRFLLRGAGGSGSTYLWDGGAGGTTEILGVWPAGTLFRLRVGGAGTMGGAGGWPGGGSAVAGLGAGGGYTSIAASDGTLLGVAGGGGGGGGHAAKGTSGEGYHGGDGGAGGGLVGQDASYSDYASHGHGGTQGVGGAGGSGDGGTFGVSGASLQGGATSDTVGAGGGGLFGGGTGGPGWGGQGKGGGGGGSGFIHPSVSGTTWTGTGKTPYANLYLSGAGDGGAGSANGTAGRIVVIVNDVPVATIGYTGSEVNWVLA